MPENFEGANSSYPKIKVAGKYRWSVYILGEELEIYDL